MITTKTEVESTPPVPPRESSVPDRVQVISSNKGICIVVDDI